MTTYETRLRGARNRIVEAAAFAIDAEAKDKLEAMTKQLDEMIRSLTVGAEVML